MSALSGLFDVIEHLVATHAFWNEGMSQDAAVVKVAAARAEAVVTDATGDADQAAKMLADAKQLITNSEGDAAKALADAKQLVADAEGKTTGDK